MIGVLNNIFITYLLKYQSEYQLHKHSAEIKPWCPPSTRASEGGVRAQRKGEGLIGVRGDWRRDGRRDRRGECYFKIKDGE